MTRACFVRFWGSRYRNQNSLPQARCTEYPYVRKLDSCTKYFMRKSYLLSCVSALHRSPIVTIELHKKPFSLSETIAVDCNAHIAARMMTLNTTNCKSWCNKFQSWWHFSGIFDIAQFWDKRIQLHPVQLHIWFTFCWTR